MFFRFKGGRRKAIDLDNTFNGSCFLVGGGSQLKEAKEKLNDSRIVTMAMNNSGTQISPNLWVGADKAEYYSESILMNPGVMKFAYITRSGGDVHGTPWKLLPNTYFITGLSNYVEKAFFHRGRDFVWWKNVFLIAVQILHRLGFRRVYTVGCGFNISPDKIYGYKTDLTKDQVAYNQRTYDMVVGQINGVLPYAADTHFELISCTPDSKLNGIIPYMELDQALEEETKKIPEHRTTGLQHPLIVKQAAAAAEAAKAKVEEQSVEAKKVDFEMPKTTILMPTYKRDALLDLGLKSIMRQKIPGLEIIVLNDGPEEIATKKIAEDHGAKYVFTGMRHKSGEEVWRVPGFAFNIGAKMAQGDVLVLTCAEMWHEEGCLTELLRPMMTHKFAEDRRGVVSIPIAKDDDGGYLKAVNSGQSLDGIFDNLKDLRAELPFLLAVKKDIYLEMGGYDEDFTGRCYDDDDFTDRLGHHKCVFVKSNAKCVHLFHPRKTVKKDDDGDRVAFNKKLFLDRRGTVVRNEGREWGILK